MAGQDNKKKLRGKDEMMQKNALKEPGKVDKPVEEEPAAAVRGKKRKQEKKQPALQIDSDTTTKKKRKTELDQLDKPITKETRRRRGKVEDNPSALKEKSKEKTDKDKEKEGKEKTKNNHQDFHQEQRA